MPGGPQTSVGKAVSRFNRVQHGLRADIPVVPGEDPEEWEGLRAGIVASVAPEGMLEAELTERAALLLWRLRRVARFETAAVAIGQETVADMVDTSHLDDPIERMTYRTGLGAALAAQRAALEDAEGRVRALGALAALQVAGEVTREEALAAIEAAAGAADVDPDRLRIPDMPPRHSWRERRTWTGGQIKAVLESLAKRMRLDVDAFLADALAAEREREEGVRIEVARLERRIAALRMERLLPDPATLQNVTRYEAHLHRQLLSTLHELEALQARRRGKETPLARIDLAGVAPRE